MKQKTKEKLREGELPKGKGESERESDYAREDRDI